MLKLSCIHVLDLELECYIEFYLEIDSVDDWVTRLIVVLVAML